MSGTLATFPFPTSLGSIPKEGSKYVSVTIPGSSVPGFGVPGLPINLLSQFQSGQFTTIQSVIVDNTTNGNAVIVTSLESGLSIHAPAYTIGRYPLICGPAPEFLLTNVPGSVVSSASGSIRLFFLNTMGPDFEAAFRPPPLSYSQFLFTPGIGGTPRLMSGVAQAGAIVGITSIDLTLSPFSAFASAQNGWIELFEQATSGLPNTGASYNQLWSTQWSAPASAQNTVFYSRQVQFPAGLFQKTPGNPLWLYSTNSSDGLNTSITMTYALYPTS